MASMSPSSSPRLPSPPPMAEDQLGPKSPTAALLDDPTKLAELASADQGSSRRIRPGTRSEDMAEGPPLIELTDIDSAFQLTEHLRALHYSLTHPDNESHTVPIDKDMAVRLSQAPEGTDRAMWLYELCWFLCEKVNSIIVALFADEPACSAQTCPEMRASEWQYLCAVHDPPKSCCAIDYCCHTLDWAANTLTSPKHFPSRLSLGTEANGAPQHVRQLTNIFRRVYRIFAHAWFQHREVFWKVEGKTGLYLLFKTVSDAYGLIPVDNYTLPPDAEGIESTTVQAEDNGPKIYLANRNEDESTTEKREEGDEEAGDQLGNATVATGNTTKRYRQPHSRNASTVPTVVEENDEEGSQSKTSEPEITEGSDQPQTLAQVDGPAEGDAGGVKEEKDERQEKAASVDQEESVAQEKTPPDDEPVDDGEEDSAGEAVIHIRHSEEDIVEEPKSVNSEEPRKEEEQQQQQQRQAPEKSNVGAEDEPSEEAAPIVKDCV